MAWVVPVVMAVGGAVAGKQQADAANAQRRQDMEMNAIETQYSPWINPQYRQVSQGGSRAGSMLGGAIAGGMQGMSLASGLQGMMKPTGPAGMDMSKATTLGASNFPTAQSQQPTMGFGSAYKQPAYLNTAMGRFGRTG